MNEIFDQILNKDEVNLLVKKIFGPKASILNYNLENYSNEKLGFTNDHGCLTLIVKDTETDKIQNKNFFLKILPRIKNTDNNEEENKLIKLLQTSSKYDQESEFYNKLLPEIKKFIKNEQFAPNCYLAKRDAIILEDLTLKGFKVCNDKILNIELLKSAARTLARLHAASNLFQHEIGKYFLTVFYEFSSFLKTSYKSN